jgi:hypothetical protein
MLFYFALSTLIGECVVRMDKKRNAQTNAIEYISIILFGPIFLIIAIFLKKHK